MDEGRHLWVILSCPIKNPIVVAVSITSKPIDQSCILDGKNDHPFLACKSYIAWHFANRRPIEAYRAMLETGKIALQEKM
jgi:hypothetical protein